MVLSCIISHIKRDIGRKLRFFHNLPAFDAPFGGVPVGILPYRLLWKNYTAWLPDGEISMMICLAFSTQYRRVMDGRTDGQTDRHLSTA